MGGTRSRRARPTRPLGFAAEDASLAGRQLIQFVARNAREVVLWPSLLGVMPVALLDEGHLPGNGFFDPRASVRASGINILA